MSCICTFRLAAALHSHPRIYSHFERSAFMEGFLSSCRFMVSVVLNKTIIADQSQASDLLSFTARERVMCTKCNREGDACRFICVPIRSNTVY